MQEVLFISKTVYGNDLIYPGDRTAELFAGLTGKKTFDVGDLALIRGLGFATRVVGYVPASL